MERVPTENVVCRTCGYRVVLSENYCWACARLNPPLAVATDPPAVPEELKQ